MDIQVPSVAPIPADTYVPQTEFGEAAISQMQPWMTLHLAWFLDAIGSFVDPVYNLVMQQGMDDGKTPTRGTFDAMGNVIPDGYVPGYASLLDPMNCDDGNLSFLAQFVGIELPQNCDANTARALIIAHQQRGTDQAILTAVRAYLTGDQWYDYKPRMRPDGLMDAYWFLVYVKPEQVIDADALIYAVNRVKPGGVMWALLEVNGYTWNMATHSWDSDTSTWANKPSPPYTPSQGQGALVFTGSGIPTIPNSGHGFISLSGQGTAVTQPIHGSGSSAMTLTGSGSGSYTNPNNNAKQWQAYTTVFGWWDNTPAGSSDIAFPSTDYPGVTLHTKAGGVGTYADPATLAVGWSLIGGSQEVPDFAPGTRFYIPNMRHYFIVEDECGDYTQGGTLPQNEACHSLSGDPDNGAAPAGSQIWIDMWGGGQAITHTQSNTAEDNMTPTVPVLAIQNPPSNYAVVSGDLITLYRNGTIPANGFGNTIVTV